jgi:hypothetical protein
MMATHLCTLPLYIYFWVLLSQGYVLNFKYILQRVHFINHDCFIYIYIYIYFKIENDVSIHLHTKEKNKKEKKRIKKKGRKETYSTHP